MKSKNFEPGDLVLVKNIFPHDIVDDGYYIIVDYVTDCCDEYIIDRNRTSKYDPYDHIITFSNYYSVEKVA
jgi:hypothetical protein